MVFPRFYFFIYNMNTYPVISKKIASESYSLGLSIANGSIILIQGFVTSLVKIILFLHC
jgi:hypothetical protein